MKQYLLPHFQYALSTLGVPEDMPIAFEVPRIAEHGDLSTNVAMTLTKTLKKNPRQIAESIVAALKCDPTIVTAVDIAGPGFINITFSNAFFLVKLKDLYQRGERIGRLDKGKGVKTNVEYVSANPTGMLHLGHGRQAAVGDTVANILEWNGYDVTREYYFNNAGNQMNKLGLSIYARYRQQLGDADFPFPEDGYHGEYIREIAINVANTYGDGLLQDIEENMAIFRKEGEKWCFANILNSLQRMNIRHDVYFNEDSLYTDGKVHKTVEELRERGLVYEKDGATWLALSRMGQLDDRVIIKSTGEPTYRLPDIAYHEDKFRRGFEYIVDIFGADHIATIPDVMAGVKALGYNDECIKVLILQFVTLMENGVQVKMSKRTGKSYTLDELLEEVGNDVVRFFFVMRGISTHLEFDLALAREQSEKNPVFYLQYAHARICSIIRNAQKQELEEFYDGDLSVLEHPAELELVKILLRFEEVVERAGELLEPQIIAEYLREVAAAFHKFYHECRILGVEEALMYARYTLAIATRNVVRNGLTILGISAPETM